MPNISTKKHQKWFVNRGEKTFIIFLKAVMVMGFYQILMSSAITTGVSLEAGFAWRNLRSLGLMNHRMLAWSGLFLILTGAPFTKIVVVYVIKQHTSNFCYWKDSWLKGSAGFLGGVLIAVSMVTVPLVSGRAGFIAFPDRMILQEIVASALSYFLIMLFAGIYYEMVFRGVLMCEWAELWNNRFWGMFVASLAYGLMRAWECHGFVTDKLIVFISGVIFSWLMAGVMIFTKSIYASMGVHAGLMYGMSGLMGSTRQTLGMAPYVTHVGDWLVFSAGSSGFEHSVMVNLVYMALACIIWSRIDAVEKKSFLYYQEDHL